MMAILRMTSPTMMLNKPIFDIIELKDAYEMK
jgi:hypothetical protein